MNKPTSNISIFQDDTGESVDDKCSFDAEFSLLESTLIDLKYENHAKSNSRNSSDELYTEAPLIIAQSENYLTPNDLSKPKHIYDGAISFELSDQCIRPSQIKHFKDNYLSIENEINSQCCKSVNVPVYSSEVNYSTSLSHFNSCNEKSNCSLTGELQKSFHDKHISSDTVVTICDSSIEICKSNPSPTISMSIENKDLDQMEFVSGFEDCAKNCVNDSVTNITEIGISVFDMENSPIQNPNTQQLSNKHNAGLINIEIMPENRIDNNTSTAIQNISNCNNCQCITVDTSLSSKLTRTFRGESKDGSTDNLQKEESLQAISPNSNVKDMLKCDLPINCEIVESSDSTPKKNKIDSVIFCNSENSKQYFDIDNKDMDDSVIFCNSENSKQYFDIDNKDMDPKKCLKNAESKDSSSLFCSTPIIISDCYVEHFNQTPKSSTSYDFEKDSQDVSCTKNKNNLKRKFFGLECIEEVDEDVSDSGREKKMKYAEDNIPCSKTRNEDNISSSMSCFETPAKSILKKWQKSSFSRASGSSYHIIDECGESDTEESQKNMDTIKKSNQDTIDNTSASVADEFEMACNSLSEELMKGQSNIEALEKYYSQVQLENQIDDEMFDEVLQEFTSNIDCGDKNSFLCKEESVAVKGDVSSTSIKTIEVCEAEKINVFGDKKLKISLSTEKNASVLGSNGYFSSSKVTNLPTGSIDIKCDKESNNLKLTDTINDNTTILEETKSVDDEVLDSSAQHDSFQSSNAEKKVGEDKLLGLDEEDVLLEEDLNSKVKQYEFHEFVSTDPKENEDNYNPEWKKLGQLTSDEERYKAVRDRWRSLNPPDPNRDLTCRQWREKNRKPPLNLRSWNNNHRMFTSDERNQLCTAVFDMKIKKFLSELDECRMGILRKRNMDFNDLAITQDKQQLNLAMRGGNILDLNILREQHIEECRKLKHHHDLELEKITRRTNEKIRVLKDAKEEVLLFQKFYKGFSTKGDDEVCLYMTDVQVQELVETEEMLEQYAKFYNT